MVKEVTFPYLVIEAFIFQIHAALKHLLVGTYDSAEEAQTLYPMKQDF